MEFYDAAFTTQLLPLVTLALGSGPEAACLKTHLDRVQPTNSIWDNVIIKNRLSATKFRLNYAAEETPILEKIVAHKSHDENTHSPISPFNSESDLFPSGVISSAWFRKYTCDVPFAVVCTYHLDSDSETDTQLAETLAITKQKYLDYNVRFVAIVVSSGPEKEDRIAHLRQISGLANLSGLFHLSLSEETLNADCEVLVTSLFNALKTSATDFYSNIEYRVKQRFKKYYTMPRSEIKTSVELSPKILETRNMIKQGILLQLMHPHNIEASLHFLEQAYENILELVNHNASHFFSKSRTAHDIKVYIQWRTLLDVITIHLVRGYLSIEESILAMRRHQAHIGVVVDFLESNSQPSAKLWAATQNQWLAELLILVPSSILQELHVDQLPKNKRSKENFAYFGGLILADKSSITTSPCLLFRTAANQLNCVNERDFQSETFCAHLSSLKDLVVYKIKLLELAKNAIMSLGAESHASLEILLICDIADCYADLGEYRKAIQFYEMAQQKCSSPAWVSIYQIISKKIITAANKSDDSKITLNQLANLSASGDTNLDHQLQTLHLSPCEDFDLESGLPFVRLDVSLFNSNLQEEVRVSDLIVTQLKIESLLDASFLEKTIPAGNFEILLDYIDIKYEDGASIRLSGNGSQESQLQTASLQGNGAQFNFSKFGKDALILQLSQEVSNTGSFSITEAVVSTRFVFKLGSKETVINKNDLFVINHQQITHVFELYTAGEDGKIYRKKKDLKGRNACKVLVKPFRPGISIDAGSDSKAIIIGEKFDVPIKLFFPGKGCSGACKSVKLSVETIIYDDMIETKDLHAQVNWDSLKDDEAMELLDAMQAKAKERVHDLHVRITKSPSSKVPDGSDLKVVLYFKLTVTGTSGEISEFDMTSLSINIVATPFAQLFSISPCAHDDSIPNPFVLEKELEPLSMPSLTRAWIVNSQLQDTHGLLKSGNISISSAKLHLRSTNAEISTSWLDELVHEQLMYGRQFVTSGKHRTTTTNVTIVASASFGYTRNGSSVESFYETEDEEFVLGLQDPRVLLRVAEVNGKVHLCYTIENPTSRIFTFSSTLTTDKAMARGTRWEFDDVRNDSPLKQTITPVLPFNQHKLEYFATFINENEEPSVVELPKLDVYDMHYKMNLPTVSLQSNVSVTESGMVLKL